MTDEDPIDDIYLMKVQSLWPHFKGEIIAQALAQWPQVIEETIVAVNAAKVSLSLDLEERQFPEAPHSSARSSFQLLRKHLPLSQLWKRSGYTPQQLDAIRLAFMDALLPLEQRANAADSRSWQLQREGKIARDAYIKKRTKHLR